MCVINIIICCIIILYIYIIIYRERTKVNRASQSRRASRREGRERTRAKDAADLFASSSPLFCSVCYPHRPHHRQPLTRSHHQQRRGKSGHPARLWVDAIATTSPPSRHRSISNQTGSPAGCLSCCPPRPHPRLLPLHQVVRVGQRASQGGRSPPAHPADPLHPAGVCGRIYRKV